jgi:subtilisin-like proprotein convertase family protein
MKRIILILCILYPNLVTSQEYFDANTELTICFDIQHTYVSDLGFYLIGPQECNSPVVILSPFPYSVDSINGCCCNSGNNIDSLCFSTVGIEFLDVCPSSTPLTGTFIGYDSVSGGTPIDWTPLYGCPITSGSWRTQVFDCVNFDFGTFNGGSLTVTGANEQYSFSITGQNSPINDNSCNPLSASVLQFGTDSIIQSSVPDLLNNTVSISYDHQSRSFYFSNLRGNSSIFRLMDLAGRTLHESRIDSDRLIDTPPFHGVILAVLYNKNGEILSSSKIISP